MDFAPHGRPFRRSILFFVSQPAFRVDSRTQPVSRADQGQTTFAEADEKRGQPANFLSPKR